MTDAKGAEMGLSGFSDSSPEEPPYFPIPAFLLVFLPFFPSFLTSCLFFHSFILLSLPSSLPFLL